MTASASAPPAEPATPASSEGRRYCVRHPQRETLVGCGRCERPFCTECLIHTPAGQRCYECAGVRRNSAQVAAGSALLKAGLIMFVGGLIASFGGLFGLLIGAFAGNMAGQTVSPFSTRHTRSWVLPLAGIICFAGTWFGWSAAIILRISMSSASRPGLALNYWSVPLALLQNWVFWVFVAIALALAYRRAR